MLQTFHDFDHYHHLSLNCFQCHFFFHIYSKKSGPVSINWNSINFSPIAASCRCSASFCCPLCQNSLHDYLRGLWSLPGISSKSPGHVLLSSAFCWLRDFILTSADGSVRVSLNKQLLVMKALPLALFIACPDPFLSFSLSRFWWAIQLLLAENCPLISEEGWCFSFRTIILVLPPPVQALPCAAGRGAGCPRLCPWAAGGLWMSLLLYTLTSQDPFFFRAGEKKKKEKENGCF